MGQVTRNLRENTALLCVVVVLVFIISPEGCIGACRALALHASDDRRPHKPYNNLTGRNFYAECKIIVYE